MGFVSRVHSRRTPSDATFLLSFLMAEIRCGWSLSTARSKCNPMLESRVSQIRLVWIILFCVIDATPKHCSTGQGKVAPPLFSAALQNRLTA